MFKRNKYQQAQKALQAAETELTKALQRQAEIDRQIEAQEAERSKLEEIRAQQIEADDTTKATETSAAIRHIDGGLADLRAVRKATDKTITTKQIALLEAERTAQDEHHAVWLSIAEQARAEYVHAVSSLAIKAWRAAIATGEILPFNAWIKSGSLMDEIHAAIGGGNPFEKPIGVDLPEREPRSSLIDSDRRAELHQMQRGAA